MSELSKETLFVLRLQHWFVFKRLDKELIKQDDWYFEYQWGAFRERLFERLLTFLFKLFPRLVRGIWDRPMVYRPRAYAMSWSFQYGWKRKKPTAWLHWF